MSNKHEQPVSCPLPSAPDLSKLTLVELASAERLTDSGQPCGLRTPRRRSGLVSTCCCPGMSATGISSPRSTQSGLIELTRGKTFGEPNLYGQSERTAFLVALSSTEVVRIDGKALSAFMDAHPELGYPDLKYYFLLHAKLLRSLNIKVGGLYAAELRNVASN